MTPRLGERLEVCSTAQIEEHALNVFEDFIRFSSRSLEKYKVKFSDSRKDVEVMKRFISHLTDFAGANLDDLEVLDGNTADMYERTLDISGVLLIERSFVDDDGIVREITYEGQLPDAPQEHAAVLGSIATQPTAVNPFVAV